MKKNIAAVVVSGLVFLSAASFVHSAEDPKNIETVLKKQDQILESLEEIKRELNVLKIRVSSKG